MPNLAKFRDTAPLTSEQENYTGHYVTTGNI